MRKFITLSLTSRILITVSIVLIACFILAVGIHLYLGSVIFSRTYKPNLIIPAPDGQHELVVCEFSCLGGAGAEIYIREPGQDKWYNSWMKKQIGNAGTDDYYETFTNGTYEVLWEKDAVTVRYYRGVPAENAADRSTWGGMVRYEME
jgi:hypothetical protein